MSIKSELLQICFEHVNKRITSYKNEIDTIKDAIESNDKSSDEDDDSGNGKLLNDLEKNAQYLSDAHKMLDTLKLINPKIQNDYVVLGSLVMTKTIHFFIGVSLGKIALNDQEFFVISKNAPVGQLMLNKKVGEQISFNDARYDIIDIK
ncbi:hypothetical protein [Sediminibacter sp. Hel_I_10]|uniref:hypothetical protein n=1 Tax=Sediminibacter sp. Hel_I_10 TaxID=1392490 RepID=UPI0005692821|nr:hypothetical protein [Sediminibacter sp. Hel_I_10]